MKVAFVCPECGDNTLVAIQITEEAQTVEDVEIGLPKQCPYIVHGDVIDTVILDTKRYGCNSCGCVVGTTELQAIDWLNRHGMIVFNDKEERPNG